MDLTKLLLLSFVFSSGVFLGSFINVEYGSKYAVRSPFSMQLSKLPPTFSGKAISNCVNASDMAPVAPLSGQTSTRTSLVDLMKASGTDKLSRHGYHRFYESLLEPLRLKTELRMLEIGVESGRSMATWVKYFENAALDGIQGVAYNANGELATSACAKEKFPGCQKMKFFTGDQSNVDFLKLLVKEGAGVDPASVKAGISPNWDRVGWDLIIDDGSHVPEHNLISFAALYPFVRPGGLYVIEDIESSYLDHPNAVIYGYKIEGAGLGKPPPGNFVEKMKQLVDVINRDWFYDPKFTILGPSVDHSIRSITFAGGMICVQKSFVSDQGYPNGPVLADRSYGGASPSIAQRMSEVAKEKPFPKLFN
jgi:hypothetical protein